MLPAALANPGVFGRRMCKTRGRRPWSFGGHDLRDLHQRCGSFQASIFYEAHRRAVGAARGKQALVGKKNRDMGGLPATPNEKRSRQNPDPDLRQITAWDWVARPASRLSWMKSVRVPRCCCANRRSGPSCEVFLLFGSIAGCLISFAMAQPATRSTPGGDFDLLRDVGRLNAPAPPGHERANSLFSAHRRGAWPGFLELIFGAGLPIGMVYRNSSTPSAFHRTKLSLGQVLATDDSVVLDMVFLKDRRKESASGRPPERPDGNWFLR